MGQARPKCLTPILGKPLIHWQLEALSTFPEVIVVIGFQGEEVERTVKSIRPDARFVTNAEYETTGTAASLSLAAKKSNGPIISIDGDLLVHPADLLKLGNTPKPCIGVCNLQSIAPVHVTTRSGIGEMLWAESFHHDDGVPVGEHTLEWTGLVTYDPHLTPISGKGHVYQMILPLLPCPAVRVRCREIDYPDEIPLMEEWLSTLISQGIFHG